MKPRDDKELMRWIDGELPREEARALEKELESPGADAEGAKAAKAKVQAMQQIGDVVRARYEAAADEAEPRLEAMWARLDKQLGPATPAREARGFWGAIRDWIDAYRGHIMTGAVCAAAAALIVLLARPPRVVEVPRETVRVVEVPQREPAIVPVKARAAEFEDIETAEGTPDLLKIPSDNKDEPPTVILVNVRGLRAI